MPSTRIPPASAGRRPQMSRIVVVFPAPSGPMRPNISPRWTESDTPLTAVIAPYRFMTPSSTMMSSGKGELRFDGHPGLERAAPVVRSHLDAVDELRPLVGGLDVARR